jgi:hypothetical protein
MASPEFEFVLQGGAARLIDAAGGDVGNGWATADEVAQRIHADFDEETMALVVGAGWPIAMTPLRLWRRR